MKTDIWHYGNQAFFVEIEPKNGSAMQVVRLTPLIGSDLVAVTKRQMNPDNDSDQTYKLKLEGTSVKQIHKELFPAQAAAMILHMQELGLLYEYVPQDDLKAIAESCCEGFIAAHTHSVPWKPDTARSYEKLMRRIMKLMEGYSPSDMTKADYEDLQIKICQETSKTSKSMPNWTIDDPPPPSGRKGLYLLYLFFMFLKFSGRCQVDFTPTLFKATERRQDLLLARTARVCSLPADIREELICHLGEDLPILLLTDTSYRLRECGGVLWCNFHHLEESQGTVYYLEVTGQLNTKGNYIEWGKSVNAYRYIPLSPQVGALLARKKKEIEAEIGRSLSMDYICGHVVNGHYVSDETYRNSYVNHIESTISDFLRQEKHVQSLRNLYPFRVPETSDDALISQDTCMYDSLTTHLTRRDCCTRYYGMGMPIEEIYQMMGHSPRDLQFSLPPGGKTEEDLRLLCLQMHVRHTNFHPQLPLCYDVHDARYSRSQVAACDIQLHMHAGDSVCITIIPTERDSRVRLDASPEAVTVSEPRFVSMLNFPFSTGFLASDQEWEVKSVTYPFRSADDSDNDSLLEDAEETNDDPLSDDIAEDDLDAFPDSAEEDADDAFSKEKTLADDSAADSEAFGFEEDF